MKLLKKIFSMLFEDFHWKLLALVVAGIIWFIGMNMSDPHQNLSVSPRLQLDSIEIMSREGIMVLNEDALRDINVTVQVRALKSDMDRLRASMTDPEKLSQFVYVNVDFRAIDSEAVFEADGVSVQTLRISANLAPGFEHLSINPVSVDVYLDTAQRQLYPVQIIQNGDVPQGFELQQIRLRNEHVTISGARSDMQMIDHVRAQVDIAGVQEDEEIIIQLHVIDIEGEDMTERVHLNVMETTAFVNVFQVRSANIRLHGVGSPAAGYALAGITSEVNSVEIVGPDEILDEIQNIRIDIDLTGASNNIMREIDISEFLPDGILLRQGETNAASVTARIEPIEERTFTIPRGNVRSRGVVGLYQLLNDTVPIRVTISGPRSIINALEGSQIEPELDLRGLQIGVHNVPLLVELPPGLTLVGSPPTLTVQIHEPAVANGGSDDLIPIPDPTPDPDNPVEPPEDDPPEDDPVIEPDDPPDEEPQGADDEEEDL